MAVDLFPVYCISCKKTLSNSDAHCPHCGAVQAPPVILPPTPLWTRLSARLGAYWWPVCLLAAAICLYAVQVLAPPAYVSQPSWLRWFLALVLLWGPVALYLTAEMWVLLLFWQSVRFRSLHIAVRVTAGIILFTASLLGAYAWLKWSLPGWLCFAVMSLLPICAVGLVSTVLLAVSTIRHDVAHAPEGLPFSMIAFPIAAFSVPFFPAGVVSLVCAAIGASKRSRLGWFMVVTSVGLMLIGIVFFIPITIHIIREVGGALSQNPTVETPK